MVYSSINWAKTIVNQQEERQDKPLSCPRGEDGCPIIEEIERLKTQVQNLSEEVRTDHLTGLYNVRHLGFSLEQEIERTRERLRECVAGSALSYDKKQLSITISLGVDAFYADSPDSIESFKHRVDQHLYAAKNAGRNCVKFKKRERIDSQVTADEKAALFDIDNNSDNKE